MNPLDKLYIAATGMITPVGFNTQMTVAAVNAGHNVYQNASYWNGNNEALIMTHVPDEALPPLVEELTDTIGLTARQSRMLRLATPAIEQIYTQLKNIPNLVLDNPMPLFLAGPEPVPNAPLPIRSVFLQHLQVQTGINIDLENSKVFPMGRAGAFFALQSAFEFLQSSNQSVALIGGVESYWHPSTLSKLMQDGRLKTEAGGADVFVPGEAAAFILLTKVPQANNQRALGYPGVAYEEGHRYSDAPYLGEGLAQAVNDALANSKIDNTQVIYSSLNGEQFGCKEFGVAHMRNTNYFSSALQHMHPADCYGDLGAATGPVLMALAAHNSVTPNLCYGSSDDEFRGAACVL